ncbi:hypothetical protein E3E31_03405 [Thermococcus sp. M39]|uniref:hypothetical protein n=1 Tax=unclassified Thermococcus TaxID=2627626 RepID=UPI0014398B55|nr:MULTISPECIES: hypothetical protein [unclassified Thermococcus]NJE07578.1 hypothetical protein [Thermococcus sp. M39]NJE12162.1 hypothetical protein [Thermococcus sp. LS2]
MIGTAMGNLLTVIIKSREVRKLISLAFLLLVVLPFPLTSRFAKDYQEGNGDRYWNAQEEINKYFEQNCIALAPYNRDEAEWKVIVLHENCDIEKLEGNPLITVKDGYLIYKEPVFVVKEKREEFISNVLKFYLAPALIFMLISFVVEYSLVKASWLWLKGKRNFSAKSLLKEGAGNLPSVVLVYLLSLATALALGVLIFFGGFAAYFFVSLIKYEAGSFVLSILRAVLIVYTVLLSSAFSMVLPIYLLQEKLSAILEAFELVWNNFWTCLGFGVIITALTWIANKLMLIPKTSTIVLASLLLFVAFLLSAVGGLNLYVTLRGIKVRTNEIY